MQIENAVCLVTGAARRVGREIARSLARRGARVVVHYGSSADEAAEAVAEFTALSGGREAFAVQADQSRPAEIEQAVSHVLDRTGRIDVLVNSASVFHATPFLEMTIDDWDDMMAVNLRGPAWFCRAVAPGMMQRGGGVIVNIADVCGDRPWPRFVPYGVSKAGLVSLTRGLARELAPTVRVVAIGPGTVLLPDGASEDLRRRAEASHALGRIGSPRDVAAACVFAIEGSDFVTGTLLEVDGGKSLLCKAETETAGERDSDTDGLEKRGKAAT